ncbi:MAG: sigma 54-interacting transcriptional regulator [Planctomycetes bacterium]|nr:sigma 54-interacting transcriptional regulator [Planctomycetota bacterium]
MPLALWAVEGPHRGAVYPLGGTEVRIGRGMDCEILLADPDASRLHATLRARQGGWALADAGSRNGTRVNGVPARARDLEPGDRIRIGSTDLVLIEQSEAPRWVSDPTPVAHALANPPTPSSAPLQETGGEGMEGFLGGSGAMKKIFSLLEKAFPTDAPVLVTGESGTGKELVARALHRNGPTRGGPWVVVHCAALPGGTLESELFGHEKGAFTGAHARRLGRFEMAHGGTIFLDEVGEIPPDTQAKLLRVLDHGEFQRVGGNETIRSRFRLVAATNRDLEVAVRAGTFRQDLFFRLQVLRVHLPPLRERTGDVPLLATHFLDHFCRARSMGMKRLAPGALALLESYPWPGNVREMKNRMESLSLFHEGEQVDAEALRRLGLFPAGAPPQGRLPMKRRELEREEILRALRETGGNKKKAAELLGIARRTLYDRLAEWNLQPPS